MKVYNTLTRQLDEFVPMDGRSVRLYTCGPTVYNYAHIGNYRCYMFEDLLRRYLKYSGFTVTQVMNLTDVDDKTIKGANEAGVALNDYTQEYKDAFFEDLATLSIERAEHYPAATDHIPEMIVLIETLVEKGFAYQSDDGSVYFSIGKFDGYGKLAHLDMDGLQSGARVAQDEYEKENASDFALWKAWSEADGPVAWDSPWGRGRPGWHIECSAMSSKYLGESFDIHTGGVDNIFPHHEDEIAQSEAASGKQFVKYWMHCAHLVVDGRKMSKSLGNFYTLRDVLEKGYTGREVRYVLLSAHYRQSLNFTFDALSAARASLSRLDDFRDRIGSVQGGNSAGLPAWAKQGEERFDAALAQDLNISDALAALFDMVHEGNRALDAGESEGLDAVMSLLDRIDTVLGIWSDSNEEVDGAVMKLLDDRAAARDAKDWAASDKARDELALLGWEVRDTPDGQKLKRLS